jgi:hypothetical protein
MTHLETIEQVKWSTLTATGALAPAPGSLRPTQLAVVAPSGVRVDVLVASEETVS